MTWGGSLERRLAFGVGLIVTLSWIIAAIVTSQFLRHEVDEQFDSALVETAQRILPLAAVEILGREEGSVSQRMGTIGAHPEKFVYLVRDVQGRVLFQSHDADPAAFPPRGTRGFRNIGDVRYYDDSVLSGSLTVTMAEPLAHRRAVFRATELVLGAALLVVIPLTLLGIILAVRRSLGPLRRLRAGLELRGAGDLSPFADGLDLPDELRPMVGALNSLLARLASTFEAERSFAANAAHELRTPLAGALAQVQRLQSETADPAARARGKDIERTLKRFTHLSERLMQLARAEGGRLRTDIPTDVSPVLRLVAEDLGKRAPEAEIRLDLPRAAVPSDIDQDAFGILCRNLIENALKYGRPHRPVEVALSRDGVLTVTNDCPAIPPAVLSRLERRFERNSASTDGAGLGLAIVSKIAERTEGEFSITSPAPGREDGFEARFVLPAHERPTKPFK